MKKSKDLLVERVDEELFIDINHINDEVMDQPLLFKKWSRLKAQQARVARSIELKLRQTEAEKWLFYSGSAKRVDDIKALVSCDKEVVELKEELLDAEYLLEDFEGILRSFYQRHESLKDLCANLRKELIS